MDLSSEQIDDLRELASSRHVSADVALRARIVLWSAEGPQQGLAIIDALAGYHLLPSIRGDLLGRTAGAREEFVRAAGLARNERERQLLLGRAAACET
jgi:predicted RNA polymerase sigma factor